MAVQYNIIFFVAALLFNYVLSDLPLYTIEPQPNIVNGIDAEIEVCPHQLSLKINVANGYYFCAAILISKTCAITAGHCCAVMGQNMSLIELRGGSKIVNNGTRLMVDSYEIHPKFNDTQFNNDCCYIKLIEESVPAFTSQFKPVTMPCRKRKLCGGEDMILAGWGAKEFGGPAPQKMLQSSDTKVVDPTVCCMFYPFIFTKNMCCGGNVIFGDSGTCQGDSGGCAFQTRCTPSGNIHCAIGITSFGRGCGQILSPSVFAYMGSESILEFILDRCRIANGTTCCNKNDLGVL